VSGADLFAGPTCLPNPERTWPQIDLAGFQLAAHKFREICLGSASNWVIAGFQAG